MEANEIKKDGKYFFCDTSNPDGRFNGYFGLVASGIVDTVYEVLPSYSGKDLAVSFLNPITFETEHEWRSLKDVKLYEVSEYMYDDLLSRIEQFR